MTAEQQHKAENLWKFSPIHRRSTYELRKKSFLFLKSIKRLMWYLLAQSEILSDRLDTHLARLALAGIGGAGTRSGKK